MTDRARALWAACFAALIALDVACDRRHDHSTLSCVARHAFRTDTRAGRITLAASWGALTGWLIPHLYRSCAKEHP